MKKTPYWFTLTVAVDTLYRLEQVRCELEAKMEDLRDGSEVDMSDVDYEFSEHSDAGIKK